VHVLDSAVLDGDVVGVLDEGQKTT
jgi:hypothetical protein